MCLIIVGPSAQLRRVLLNTTGLVKSIYDANSDGIGAMYGTRAGAKAIKVLPKSVARTRTLIENLPNDDRQAAVHWRMRTHGNIDKDNCHPYRVEGGWLMHNGVLDIGNQADPSKSDTWHYARTFLDGVIEHVAHHPQYLDHLTDHIGHGNKFVLLTNDGRMSIAGKHRGVEYEGLWFSNTYAWDVSLLDPNWSRFERDWRSRNFWGYDEDEREDAWFPGSARASLGRSTGYRADPEDWQFALEEGDIDSIEQFLAPGYASANLNTLFATANAHACAEPQGRDDADICDAIETEDATTLARICARSTEQLRRVCAALLDLFYFSFIDDVIDDEDELTLPLKNVLLS